MYILSLFFPGYHNVGGYHGKYSIQNFYEKIKQAGLKEDSLKKWLIGWQRFTIPGMEIESQYSNGLEIPECVEFKVIPHVMTPLKAFKFLYNLVPDGEQVLFLDFLFFDLPFLEILKQQKEEEEKTEQKEEIDARIVFQENSMFFYDTLVYFKKDKDIEFNEKDEFIIKISRKKQVEQEHDILVQRKLVSIEEIAILEFYTSKYPSINDSSARIIQYLGGKLNVNIDFESMASKELEDFVFNSCKSLIKSQDQDDNVEKKEVQENLKSLNSKPRPRIVF